MKVKWEAFFATYIYLNVSNCRRCCYVHFKTPSIPERLDLPQDHLDLPLSNHEKAEDRLKWIDKTLKSFGSDRDFDLIGFELRIESLSHQVTEVEDLVRALSHPSKTLLKKLAYVKGLLRETTGLTELLKFFNHTHSLDQVFVNRLIKLNLRILTLFDSIDTPAYWKIGYQDTVMEIYKELQIIRQRFGILNNVTEALSLAFKNQITQADRSIKSLTEYISKSI